LAINREHLQTWHSRGAIPHCALHHSAVISLNFGGLFDRDVMGFAPLRILSAKGRHGVACRESSPPYSVSPPLASNAWTPIAARERFFSGDPFHPFGIHPA
jgi:hypothetical protein